MYYSLNSLNVCLHHHLQHPYKLIGATRTVALAVDSNETGDDVLPILIEHCKYTKKNVTTKKNVKISIYLFSQTPH